MVARVLRAFSALAVVFVTSIAVVMAPVAPAAASVESTAGKVVAGATKTVPVRLLACANPALCLAVNTVGAGAMWWLMDTESGANFRSDVWNWAKGLWPYGKKHSANNCEVGVGVTWAGGMPTVSITGLQHKSDMVVVGPGGTGIFVPGCEGAQQNDYPISGRFNTKCRRPDGTISNGAVFQSNVKFSQMPWAPAGPLCAGDHTFIGVEITSGTGLAAIGAGQGWYPSPDVAQWDLDGGGKFRTETTCLNGDGSTTKVTAESVAGALSPVAAPCPAGSSPINQDIAMESPFTPGWFSPVSSVGLVPDAVQDYDLCLGAGATGCTMDVWLDGVKCAYGVTGCESWWSKYQADAERVECRWGPYSLPGSDCEQLRYAYVTPGGGVVDPTLPPESMPQPVVPEQPGDPVNPVPSECPPTGSPIEGGLNPAALNVMRCAMVEYPWIIPTSGYREGSEYDHGTGDAVDLAPPAWDTPLGRDRGWWLAHWLVANAGALDITYVIFADMRWPAYDGSLKWVPYQHPSGLSDPSSRHLDHVHVSARGRTAPQPQPGDPVHPPGTPPVTEPGPVFPGTGENPDPGDGTNCLDGAWNWNPVSWVYTPIKCGMLWAFVPPEGSSPFGDAAEALDGTTVGGWIQAPGDVFRAVAGIGGVQGAAGFDQVMLGGGSAASVQSALISSETMATDCRGPDVTMGLPSQLGGGQVTINPLNACSMPVQFLAAVLHSSLDLAVWLGAFVACLNTVSGAFGLQSQLRAHTESQMKGA